MYASSSKKPSAVLSHAKAKPSKCDKKAKSEKQKSSEDKTEKKPAFSESSEGESFKIFIVLWNGKTDVEKGFVTYLKGRGVNFSVEQRDCEGDRAKCHALVKEIRDLKPHLIYTWGTPACEEIAGRYDQPKSDYIWDIPMISLIVSDPVSSKLIYSLQSTGRNVTGVSHVAPVEVQLNSILLYKKDLKRLAAIYNPDETNSVTQVTTLKDIAEKKGIQVLDLPVPLTNGKPDPMRIRDQVRQAHAQKAEFIYTAAETFLSLHCNKLVKEANTLKIPTFAATESMYWEGLPMIGMLSRWINIGLFGGFKAYQILVEKKDPKDIPYETLSRFSYIVGKPTYEAVGLVPPISLLQFSEIVDKPLRS